MLLLPGFGVDHAHKCFPDVAEGGSVDRLHIVGECVPCGRKCPGLRIGAFDYVDAWDSGLSDEQVVVGDGTAHVVDEACYPLGFIGLLLTHRAPCSEKYSR